MSAYKKVSATWKPVAEIYHNVGGNWEQVQEQYIRSNGTWDLVFKNTFEFDLTAGVNVSFLEQATNAGAKLGDNVIGTIPAGVTIGGSRTDIPALRMNDISGFKHVTLNVKGHIHGKGGSANSGRGGHAFGTDHHCDVIVFSGGSIYGGGGGGGKGGQNGDDASIGGFTTGNSGENRWWASDCYPIARYTRYLNHHIGYPCGRTYISNGDKVYRDRGDSYTQRAQLYQDSGAQGGDGGKGRGYEGAGTGGTNRGGAGGTWATAGTAGTKGNNGTKVQDNGNANSVNEYHFWLSLVTDTGSNGGAAGGPGKAIDANGVQIRLTNNGQMLGEQDLISVPF